MISRLPPVADDAALPEDERALLARARSLIPGLAKRAAAATAARRLPATTIAEYRAAGILRILQRGALADGKGASVCFRGSSRN